MARPGGWNLNGLEFSQEHEVRALIFGDGRAEEVPLDVFISERDSSHITALKRSTIQILEARGGHRAGFNASRDLVERICQSWGIPELFQRKINKPGSLPYFAQLAEKTSPPTQTRCIKAINLGFRWGPGHSNYLVCFGRFDFENSTFRAFLSSRDVLKCPSALELMAGELDTLHGHPLELFRLILESCEQYIDRDAQDCNKKMIEIGASLRVMDKGWTDAWGINRTDNSSDMSSTIYVTLDSVSWLKKNCCELIDIGQRYLDLVEEIRNIYHCDLPKDGVGDITHRAKLHCHMLAYLEAMLASQFNFHSNVLMQQQAQSALALSKSSKNIAAASQRDASSMKTISYLTLIFLPATFVSAIFSTTIFDFQNWGIGGNASVVSPGWWVFILSCSLTTLITLSGWFWWHRGDVKRWENTQKSWNAE
ncbi:hypothetical protein B0J15DRAFT_473276 [Fusarium solani]|uniref:Uncharacterized protein n=1 Tax=Fusarium solani TaxID=169388 RepID=A0A9P9G0M8_FUSSL|nr:uncharacterized protein B0J15DRAFT_473276 [Fusarium solani]KAH7228647.1 hypothetical protein B0J15DRAFT_473276 [Fusarium solani]